VSDDLLLEAEALVKRFGDYPAVNGLDLRIRAGEMVGLVGPDGAGKTTTMRMLCGALTPSSGRIRISGYEVPGQVERAREQTGYLAQNFSLYGDLTSIENLRFFGSVFDLPDDEIEKRTKELLAFAGLTDFARRPARQLSGGMQKKLGLATALIHSPRVLLLDEPTGGVDPVARQEFWQLLIGLLRRGSAVLVSTPYMDEAMRFSRVVFMDKGRALLDGMPRDLLNRLKGRILELAAQPQAAARPVAASDPQVEDVQTFGDRFHLRVTQPAGPMARLPHALSAAGITVTELKPIDPTLEDVFIHLLKTEADGYAADNRH
jgi:ABC-2 type transport system ATP-binding protein